MTGPGNTVYGESLFDGLESKDKLIRLNFILSKNKDSYDKTYKEKEIEKLKYQMVDLKKGMQEEYTKQLLNEKLKFDKERDEMLKQKELELEEMESRLKESQRSLKAVYNLEDRNEEQGLIELKKKNQISENFAINNAAEQRRNDDNFNNVKKYFFKIFLLEF